MKFVRSIIFLLTITGTTTLTAQSDHIQLGSRQYDVLDRLEIKLRTDSVLNFSATKPFERKSITERLQYIKQLELDGKISLSKVDKYNINLLLLDNFDQRADLGDTTLAFKSIFAKTIKTKPLYLGVKRGDFSFYLTPAFNNQIGKDNGLSGNLFNTNRGFYVRGQLTKGIGYYTYYTTNQERDPLYAQQYVTSHSAVPGNGYFKSYLNNGYDYFDARGGVNFKIAKGINGEFAYDKVFIGNGFRSLILSDFSNNFLFFKINTRLWKFNYYNLFGQMVSTYQRGADQLLPKKYLALHYLEFQANKWLNIGVFENIMFGRSNGFDFNYLNPIIFYRSIELQNGSPDKVTLGFTIKANAFKNTQLYSQIIVNEYQIKEILHYSRGAAVNKQALQLGFKSIDVFGVKNLDVQGEVNFIRPFVYSHYDTVGSFTHYNQPLAHPAGANLREFIGVIKYQPLPKLNLQAKLIYYEQGLDSAGQNFGASPFRFYTDKSRDYGYKIGSGILAKTLLASFSASYELIPNLFIEGNATIRKFTKVGAADFDSNLFTVGFRMNMQRRVFDF